MSEETRLFQRLHPGVTSEQARDVRARAWAFVFECWHTKKGDQHDLTRESTKKWITRTDKRGTDNADLCGD
jgi:hypothetical protein